MIDAGELYRQVMRARSFELLLADMWQRGLISGELHLGTGEEAIAAGVVVHLRDGDALALDHRSTPPLGGRVQTAKKASAVQTVGGGAGRPRQAPSGSGLESEVSGKEQRLGTGLPSMMVQPALHGSVPYPPSSLY